MADRRHDRLRLPQQVNALFVNADAEAALSTCYGAFVGEVPPFQEIAYRGRKLAMEQELASEFRVLANEINHLTETDWFTRDFTLVGLRQALREIVACFPVYRTYVDSHGSRPEDRRDLDWAVDLRAAAQRPLRSQRLRFPVEPC